MTSADHPFGKHRCSWCARILWPWSSVRIVTWYTGSAIALHVGCASEYRKMGDERSLIR